ncbi:polyprenyl synthetase family protein [Streptomyces violascens]|uniref:polyprenyl synthetase family protein n=1 Tax=Streptomyces violascens TaxID=67381 RepID=UPI00367C6A52
MSGDPTCGTSRWMQMARQKTAALISAACQVGSVLSGAGDGHTAALAKFGEHLGLAFQMRDDLLPYDHRTLTIMGTPADSDIRNHRPTYPLLLAWEQASPSQRDDLVQTLRTTTDPAHASTRLRTLLGTTGALAAARETADRHE